MVGFDKTLNRLGYGKGYYDRTISKLRKLKKIFVIGLAYDNQMLQNIPAVGFELPLHTHSTMLSAYCTFHLFAEYKRHHSQGCK